MQLQIYPNTKYSRSKYVFFTALIFHGSAVAFKTVPQNQIAVFGSDVEFQCSTDSSKSLSWSVRDANKAMFSEVSGLMTSFGEEFVKIDTSIRGKYDLTVKSVVFQDAGKYKCSEGSFGPEVEADLAVIGEFKKSLNFDRLKLNMALYCLYRVAM